MKLSKLLFFVFFIVNGFSYSQVFVDEILIEEGSRNITNLSGRYNEEISFNLIINKNKKTDSYTSTLYFYDRSNLVYSQLLLESKVKPSFLSYHVNENLITFIRKESNKVLIYDYNFDNKEIQIASSRIKPKLIFSHRNRTFLISEYKNRFIQFAKIESTSKITELIVKANSLQERKFLSNLNNNDSEFIDNSKFILRGSIKKYRGFYQNSNLVFLNDDPVNGIVNLFKISDNGKIEIQELKIKNGVDSKKQNSYMIDNYIFTLNLWKNKGVVNIYNLNTLTLINSFEYFDDERFGLHNKVVVNGYEETEDFSPKKFFRKFYSAAIGTVYNSTPYIGVNKSNDGGYILQFGHVDKNVFYNQNAYNDWWVFPAFNMNFNSMNVNSTSVVSNVAGAANLIGTLIINAAAEKKRKGNYLELNLDSQLLHTQNKLKAEKEYFSFIRYKQRYEYKYKFNKHFFIPMDGYIRLINFDKKEKKYKLYNLRKITSSN